jgi:hypothetical protein
MRFRRLSRNTLKPHCEPNSISMNGVGVLCEAFSEMESNLKTFLGGRVPA